MPAQGHHHTHIITPTEWSFFKAVTILTLVNRMDTCPSVMNYSLLHSLRLPGLSCRLERYCVCPFLSALSLCFVLSEGVYICTQVVESHRVQSIDLDEVVLEDEAGYDFQFDVQDSSPSLLSSSPVRLFFSCSHCPNRRLAPSTP